MPQHAELPEEPFAGGPSPANDPTVPAPSPSLADFDDDTDDDTDVAPAPVRTPRRFGRLALWTASATALGVGVLGTVAYGMWFNHDQRVYAEAMTSARETLGIDQPVLAATQSSGVVEAPVMAHPENIKLAGSPPALERPALSAVAAAPAVVAEDDAVQQRAAPAGQSGNRASRASEKPVRTAQANQNTKRRAPPAKAEPGLFARVGAFFHRVSYRRNATSGQREEYSRP